MRVIESPISSLFQIQNSAGSYFMTSSRKNSFVAGSRGMKIMNMRERAKARYIRVWKISNISCLPRVSSILSLPPAICQAKNSPVVPDRISVVIMSR